MLCSRATASYASRLHVAISFAAIDLVHKSIATAEFHHARTPLVALMMVALIAALVVFVPRVPSNAAAIGAGDRMRRCARKPHLASSPGRRVCRIR